MTFFRTRILLGLAAFLALVSFAAAQSKKPLPKKPIDLNTASFKELQQLPGVGPVAANNIMVFRVKSGPFRRIEDLLAVKGFTKKRLEKLRPYITVTTPIQKGTKPQEGAKKPPKKN